MEHLQPKSLFNANIIIGSLVFTISLICIILNCLVLYVLYKEGFLRRHNRYAGIYILAFGIISNDIILLSFYMGYLAPSCIFQVRN